MKYIAYYRRSKKQYASTLGIESQQAAVRHHVERHKGELLNEYTEIESGTAKKREKRTVILDAILECKEKGATLIIAKLDRLARDIGFISDLINSKVQFLALDIPNANNLTIHILAAVAENEARTISERIKAALEVKKKRGEPLGIKAHKDPQKTIEKGFGVSSIQKARQVLTDKANSNPNNRRAIGYARTLRDTGMLFEDIVRKMNKEGFRSSQGKKVRVLTVRRWIERGDLCDAT